MEIISFTSLSKELNVHMIDNFITPEECAHMIEISKPSMKASLVSETEGGVESDGRSSKNAWIKHGHDEITLKIAMRIATFVNIPLENAEAFQVIHYRENAEYRNHYDSWLHDGSVKTLRCMKYGGARLKTALVYLNDVEEGGSTHFPRINVHVAAQKGRLLVFDNTYKDSNIRDHLSEHAGMPVIKGEKYAFNLWFREHDSKKLYSTFNPDYYYHNELEKYTNHIQHNVFTSNQVEEIKMKKREVYTVDSFLTSEECDAIIQKCDFRRSSGKYLNCWIAKEEISEVIRKVEKLTKFRSEYWENINVFKYSPNQSHGPFMEAYDLHTENGKKYTKQRGQRLLTLSISLNNTIQSRFHKISKSCDYHPGSLILYDNIQEGSYNARDDDMSHTLTNANETDSYVLNIYVREFDANGEKQIADSLLNLNVHSSFKDGNSENYIDTLKKVLAKFRENEITITWKGIDSFSYNFKGDFEYFTQSVKQLECNPYRLNPLALDQTYSMSEYTPVVVEDVLAANVFHVLREYYKTTIQSGVFTLGDKQSKRFKAHNEPMSRILQYLLIPLIEKILNKKVCPTYTYLSAYVNGSDLPAHTDRPDCEYTVSFVIDKPDNVTWPIYVHLVKQPMKHKGRYDFTPLKEECLGIDCKANGLMIFSGTDHIHFRENLAYDFYNILLLHYKTY